MTIDVFHILITALFAFGGLLTASEPISELKARKNKPTVSGRKRGNGRRKKKRDVMCKPKSAKSKAYKAPELSDIQKLRVDAYRIGRDGGTFLNNMPL